MGDLTKNFSRREFACPQSGQDHISTVLVERLQEVRDALGLPVVITSGVRGETYNRDIGGVPNSAHVKGLAVDIACRDSVYRNRLLRLLFPRFRRIGIGRLFVHVDIDPTKPQDVIWDYYTEDHVA